MRALALVRLTRGAGLAALCIASTMLLAPADATAQGGGRTYYVAPNGDDSATGSLNAPWRTIQRAADALEPGDSAILLDGIYEEASVRFTRSGSADRRITIRARNKWGAIVSSISGCDPGFSISASHVTVQDIRFSVSPRNRTCANYTSSNVHIRAWEKNNPSPANPDSGFVGFVASGLKIDPGLQRAEGLKSNQDLTVIENSEIGNSVELFNVRDAVIRNNTITGQNQWGISIFVKGGVRNAQVYNNVIRNLARNGYGIYLGGSTSDPWHFDGNLKVEAYNSVAYNNVVINESGGNMTGLIFAGARDSAFFNNVVIGGTIEMTEGGPNSRNGAATTNPRIQNNIVTCPAHANATALAGNYSGTLTIGNNNFFRCGRVPPQDSPVIGDPLLVNPAGDWRLQPLSPARGTGAAVSMTGYDGAPIDVSRDRNGALRSSPWDLGVYRR